MNGDERLSDYLLGEDGDDERAEMERRMAADPALRDRVTRLQDVTERLRGLPSAAWEATAPAGSASEHPAPSATPSGRHAGPASSVGRARPRRWLAGGFAVPGLAAGLAALVLFAAGLGAGVLVSGSGGGSPAQGRALALRPLTGAPSGATGVAYLSKSGHLALVIEHLPVTGSGRYYEAWLMTSTTRLVPLATFRVGAGGSARLDLVLPAAATSYRYIDVSLQSVAAGTVHSPDSVLRGPTSPG